MQDDLNANYPELGIHILGVNEAGFQAGNGSITAGRDIPWLQDLDDVWSSWAVNYRDVVILDAENVTFAAFNLTVHNLQIPENYNTMRQMFIDAALIPEPASLALLAIGAVGLLPRVRRRRRT